MGVVQNTCLSCQKIFYSSREASFCKMVECQIVRRHLNINKERDKPENSNIRIDPWHGLMYEQECQKCKQKWLSRMPKPNQCKYCHSQYFSLPFGVGPARKERMLGPTPITPPPASPPKPEEVDNEKEEERGEEKKGEPVGVTFKEPGLVCPAVWDIPSVEVPVEPLVEVPVEGLLDPIEALKVLEDLLLDAPLVPEEEIAEL